MPPADDEIAKLTAQFGKPTVGPDGKMSWNIGPSMPGMPGAGAAPSPGIPPHVTETPGGPHVTWLPPVGIPGKASRFPAAVVPLLSVLLGVEVLRLLLELLRYVPRT